MNLITPDAACVLLGCTNEDLDRLVQRRVLTTLRLGDRVRFLAEEIEILADAFVHCIRLEAA